MKLKNSVKLVGLKPEALLGIMICNSVFEKYGEEMVLTSVTDGLHMNKSLHYVGYAWDIRISNLVNETNEDYCILLKNALGNEFDVVLSRYCIHVEYQPKTERR